MGYDEDDGDLYDSGVVPLPKKPRGFAAMTPERRKEIAAMGGRKAHANGNAHRFNSVTASIAGKAVKKRNIHSPEKAREYGKKGGEKSAEIRRNKLSE